MHDERTVDQITDCEKEQRNALIAKDLMGWRELYPEDRARRLRFGISLCWSAENGRILATPDFSEEPWIGSVMKMVKERELTFDVIHELSQWGFTEGESLHYGDIERIFHATGLDKVRAVAAALAERGAS